MNKKTMLVLVMCLTAISIFAVTNTWDGSSSWNWNTTANWSRGTVPTASEDVVLTWDAFTGADSYKVYSSDDPEGGWILQQENISGLTWNET
ncbi:MAG: hypothetical protein K8S23_13270 [Candidatus Cloacimonetes bacterium]|nr:hypothetical protein [Candidatus Cloacimonadota bacterium]